ncbi:putative duf408 domain-containing protein [Eutypa lata UCREL1]|uniref:RNA polymerase II subunit B1 CTD phosphatase RPAP2 homolog n=1 Tax=Eutypa lata (strain UCR-EL1) TaxID=1287681 RepID=M7STA9_EUTLA|nr:putative duf408 domain-containing protein [Eutypa lata UCREL1]
MASQTQKAPLKGILKKPTAAHPGGASDGSSTVAVAASPSPSSGGAQKKPDPREVAIQHARIIHDRRALEDSITDSIILLAKLPTTLPTDSSISPSTTTTNANTDTAAAAAAELFKTHIRLFQPSDYDALIEERNALGSCGYCLCPRPRKRFGPASGVGGGGGEYKILNWGRADFAIAPRAEVERWCSRGRAWCARAAMYVKVQLSETAAWERAGIESIRIELLEEVEDKKEDKEKEKGMGQQQVEHKDKSDTATAAATAVITKELEGLRLREREREREETDRRQKAARDARDLALERGDTDEKEAAKRSVDVTIREKRVVTGVQEPTLAPGGDEDHLVLDGYKTKFDPKSETMARGTTSTSSTTIVKASDE